MDPNNTIEDWAARELAADAPAQAPKGIKEEDIAEKVRLGLDRAQAIAVLTAQAERDAEDKKTAKPAKPAKA